MAKRCTLNTPCGKLFTAAQKAYNAQNYADALVQLKSAYSISANPILLINIGCAMYKLRHYEDAIEKFRLFLKLRPNSRHAGKVSGYLADTLRQQIPRPVPAVVNPLSVRANANPTVTLDLIPTTSINFPAATVPSVKKNRQIAIAISSASVSIGLIGIVAGAGCYGTLASLQNSFRMSADEFDKQNMINQAIHLKRASTANYVIGGLLMGAGIGMFSAAIARWPSKRKNKAATIELGGQITPAYLGASLGWTH